MERNETAISILYQEYIVFDWHIGGRNEELRKKTIFSADVGKRSFS